MNKYMTITIISGILISFAFFIWLTLKNRFMYTGKFRQTPTDKEAFVQSIQDIAMFVVQNINIYNTDILHWIEEKKQKGQQAPKIVENSSRMIALTIQALTENAYLIPYSETYNNIEANNFNHLVKKNQQCSKQL